MDRVYWQLLYSVLTPLLRMHNKCKITVVGFGDDMASFFGAQFRAKPNPMDPSLWIWSAKERKTSNMVVAPINAFYASFPSGQNST